MRTSIKCLAATLGLCIAVAMPSRSEETNTTTTTTTTEQVSACAGENQTCYDSVAKAKKAEIYRKFDTNRDGKLSKEECEVARKANWGSTPRSQRKELLEKYDADKDGKLNESERAQMKKDLKNHFKDLKENTQ